MISLQEVVNSYENYAGPCLTKEEYKDPEFHSFYPTQQTKPEILVESLNLLKKQGLLKSSGNFLDLGAFRGLIPITAGALFHLNAYGIEARPGAVSLANKVVEGMKKEGYFYKTDCKISLGNFFPQDFEVTNRVRWAGLEKNIPDFIKSADPYKQMGLNLDGFDIIFFYQFTNNIMPILNMLSEKCKKDSLILLPHELYSIDIPKNLELLSERTMSVYKKN